MDTMPTGLTALVLACTAATLLGQSAEGDGVPTQAPATAEPRYLLFWRGPDQVPALLQTIGQKGDGRTRLLGFGLPCSTFEQEQQVPELIHLAFATARTYDVALMLHFDFHVAWQNRPDLWNWFDPQKPGYDPANSRNVEWFGWEGPPAKVRYLNWGVPQRMAPPMCFTSPAVRAEWTRLIRHVICPPLTAELAALEQAGKSHLFAGVLVGSEPTFDNYTHADPETAKMAAEDGSPLGQLGFRALLDRGYSSVNPPDDIHQALAGVIQETVSFWCRQFAEEGLPTGKLYPHIAAGAPVEVTCAPPWTAVNPWSRAGWSTYAVGSLEQGSACLYDVVKDRVDPAWGGVEANTGFPGSLVDWETYLGWHYNHGAALVAINTGATGTELPDRLKKSAFGPEALAAYRKFLGGEALVERPVSQDNRGLRLQRAMDALQAGFRAWQAAGRDPSPIARGVEDRLPALLQAGEVEEAVAVLEDALRRLEAADR
jgi:hypothetical protein